ncbi:hypothetical protein FACS1894182_05330 [Bacteroidia bacterium]|nr:hypothetical protein FACS1894182_05330 [Bacteroidia bacterium]
MIIDYHTGIFDNLRDLMLKITAVQSAMANIKTKDTTPENLRALFEANSDPFKSTSQSFDSYTVQLTRIDNAEAQESIDIINEANKIIDTYRILQSQITTLSFVELKNQYEQLRQKAVMLERLARFRWKNMSGQYGNQK